MDPGLYSSIPKSFATSIPKALLRDVPKLTSSMLGTGKKQTSTGFPVLVQVKDATDKGQKECAQHETPGEAIVVEWALPAPQH